MFRGERYNNQKCQNISQGKVLATCVAVLGVQPNTIRSINEMICMSVSKYQIRAKNRAAYNFNSYHLFPSPDHSPGYSQPPHVRKFCFHIEKYWETVTTNKNDQQREAKILKKYGVFQFKDDNYGIIYTTKPINIQWGKERMGDGWPLEILLCGKSTRILTPSSPGIPMGISSTSSITSHMMMVWY